MADELSDMLQKALKDVGDCDRVFMAGHMTCMLLPWKIDTAEQMHGLTI